MKHLKYFIEGSNDLQRSLQKRNEKERKKTRGKKSKRPSPRVREKTASDYLELRPYQVPVFKDHQSGILVLHWSRQIGKSFVLAAWAVQRLLMRPGRLVTVLSNSRENGAEFLAKCAEVCRIWNTHCETADESRALDYHAMRMELRIRERSHIGRIKVLAANPRTARGFSGDLILDEFAFHEDSAAIWEAAEPILASNPDFLCRIASTGNGKHNMFYQMVANGSEFRVPGSELKGAGEKVERANLQSAQVNVLPLPEGEGRGEGEVRVESSTRSENSAACPLTPTLSPNGGEGVETAASAKAPLSSILHPRLSQSADCRAAWRGKWAARFSIRPRARKSRRNRRANAPWTNALTTRITNAPSPTKILRCSPTN
jgi:hypothetical protein